MSNHAHAEAFAALYREDDALALPNFLLSGPIL